MTVDTAILDAFDDRAAWHGVLNTLPERCNDVYFRPEYVRLHLFEPGSRALLFVYRQGRDTWAYPFLLQPIVRIGHDAPGGRWCDIESAYGYGGPLCTTDDRDFVTRANSAFLSWSQEQRVVAEFIRLHPLLAAQKWLGADVEVTHDRDTVSLDLNALGAEPSVFGRAVRATLRRAERLNVQVAAYSTSDGLDRFRHLYHEAMKRLRAANYYLFDDAYFAGLWQLVTQAGWLYVATLGAEWVAAALFLKGRTWMHFHLAASRPERPVPGAMNAILLAAARLGRREGLERLHLGGGRTAHPGDSLLRFKRSMTTDAHHFCIGKRIHDSSAYAYLRDLWEKQYPRLVARYRSRLLCYRSGSETSSSVDHDADTTSQVP